MEKLTVSEIWLIEATIKSRLQDGKFGSLDQIRELLDILDKLNAMRISNGN